MHVDSGAILGDTTTKLHLTPIANATDYVIDIATSRTALNQKADIASQSSTVSRVADE